MDNYFRILINIANDTFEAYNFIAVLVFVMGIGLFIHSFTLLGKMGGYASREVTKARVLTEMGIGTAFMAIVPVSMIFLQTAFVDDISSDPYAIFEKVKVVGSVFSNSSAQSKVALVAIIILVRFIGYISLIRGIWLFKPLSEGKLESAGAPWVHIIAGMVLINLPVILSYLENYAA